MKMLLSLLMVGVMFFSAGCANAGPFDNPLMGKKAPDFKLSWYKGGEASLEGLRKGGKAVVFFWATWCPHCREQLKEIDARKVALQKLGAAVILVNIGEEKEKIEKFMVSKSYDFNVLMDADSSVADAYQVAGIPTIVFIGSDGNIRDIENGFPDNYADILK